jgi:hypothetical protein
MTAGGVIPAPEEREPHVREIGRMEDIDGAPIVFSINLDGTLRIQISDVFLRPAADVAADLDHDAREQFQRLFMEAERQAEEEERQAEEEENALG